MIGDTYFIEKMMKLTDDGRDLLSKIAGVHWGDPADALKRAYPRSRAVFLGDE